MGRELEYALVTSSALPQDIQGSRFYESLDKEQWLDLVEYSSDLVKQDESQEVLFLIVAKGTDAQIKEDEERRAKQSSHYIQACEERDCLHQEVELFRAEVGTLEQQLEGHTDLEAKYAVLKAQMDDIRGKKTELAEELDQMREQDEREEERFRAQQEAALLKQKELRKRSVELFNALYNK